MKFIEPLRSLQETPGDSSVATTDYLSVNSGDQFSKTILVIVIFLTMILVLGNMYKVLLTSPDVTNDFVSGTQDNRELRGMTNTETKELELVSKI